MKANELARYIDHTLLRQDAKISEIERLVDEAKAHGFYSVCIQPCYTRLAKSRLEGSDVKLAVVVGFPMGSNESSIKAEEARLAVSFGADEIDMVINLSAVKSGKYDYVGEEISLVRKASQGAVLKVIIETSFLTKTEIVRLTEIAVNCGADFVKTSTGYFGAGATVENVRLMAETANGRARIKASGGIRDYDTALAMIEAGAARIGASAGIKILEGAEDDAND